MYRKIVSLMVSAVAAGITANVNAAGFVENFDSGYTDAQYLVSPWTSQSSPNQIWARNLPPSYTLSDGFCIGQDGPASTTGMASRPTGAGTSDTDVVATIGLTAEIPSSDYSLFTLSANANPDGVNGLWRDAGSFSLLWTPSFGVELYGGLGSQSFPGLLTGFPSLTYVNFKLETAQASGAQAGTAYWKFASGSTWNLIGSVPLDATFSAANVGVLLKGASWGDDVSFSSISSSTYYDYNGNHLVDAADYILWRKTLNQSVAPGSGADGNGNGVVGNEDYLLWRSQFGTVVPGAGVGLLTTSVPEPANAILLASGSLLVLLRMRREEIGSLVHCAGFPDRKTIG